MPKLSIDQLFLKAKLYEKKGYNKEAQKLYESILETYPKNIRAKDSLYALNKQKLSNTDQKIPEAKIKQLVNLYNQGKLSVVLEQAKVLVKQYQNAFIIWNLLGAANKGLGKIVEASNCFRTVTKLNPNIPDGHNNLGVTLQEQGKLEEAIESFNKAVSLKPNYPEAYNNFGITFREQGKLEEAIEAYNKAVSLKPNYEKAQAQKLFQKANICDWETIKQDKNLISKLGKLNNYIFPFSVLSLEDTPKEHKLRSELYARIKYSNKKKIAATNQPLVKNKRLRIGYFSADFHNHATMYLISKIFEEHNKEKFEIYAYSYGPSKKNNEMRQKLIKSVDFFKNVRKMNDKDIALLARQDKIDIAVDLKGYTRDTRTGIFAYRAAPIQINYLGYPGTMGADFIDYIIADAVVIPDNIRNSYSEKIIYLPHTYQPNDNTRLISKKVITKNEMNLPNEGFIFCCFNNNYKITPTEFDIWMRLLIKIEGSVLWLIRSNKWAEINLCKEAEKRGVSKERLIFSDNLPQAEHLARHKLADLFLDTFNYNAHTTTSDALWAGLPVITKLGKSFSARVAGSLLKAIGLSELVLENKQDYEKLIFELATSPKKLLMVKEKLDANRLSMPLFDSKMYTKHLEDGYKKVYQNYYNGKKPQTIYVKA